MHIHNFTLSDGLQEAINNLRPKSRTLTQTEIKLIKEKVGFSQEKQAFVRSYWKDEGHSSARSYIYLPITVEYWAANIEEDKVIFQPDLRPDWVEGYDEEETVALLNQIKTIGKLPSYTEKLSESVVNLPIPKWITGEQFTTTTCLRSEWQSYTSDFILTLTHLHNPISG